MTPGLSGFRLVHAFCTVGHADSIISRPCHFFLIIALMNTIVLIIAVFLTLSALSVCTTSRHIASYVTDLTVICEGRNVIRLSLHWSC
jgi:hypothetical protein